MVVVVEITVGVLLGHHDNRGTLVPRVHPSLCTSLKGSDVSFSTRSRSKNGGGGSSRRVLPVSYLQGEWPPEHHVVSVEVRSVEPVVAAERVW